MFSLIWLIASFQIGQWHSNYSGHTWRLAGVHCRVRTPGHRAGDWWVSVIVRVQGKHLNWAEQMVGVALVCVCVSSIRSASATGPWLALALRDARHYHPTNRKGGDTTIGVLEVESLKTGI